MSRLDTAIALTRFGVGARPGEMDRIGSAGRDWLREQIGQVETPQGRDLRTSREAILYFREEYQPRLAALQDGTTEDPERARTELGRLLRSGSAAAILARTQLALTTEAGFVERWVRFWSNHFSVSMTSPPMALLAPTLEMEAIRPHAFGRFEDLLLAAELHPAMLFYLDNASSVGPTSRAGRRRGRGLNENLARETLELHTLGVDGGYSQDDIVALARLLTGWTIGNERLRHRSNQIGRTVFDERIHEPGAQTLLGERISGAAEDKAPTALRQLARHPSTAQFVATKLARHFIADHPDAADIAHIAQAFIDSDGDLAQVANAVITAPGAFQPDPQKFKTPEEYLVSTVRALNLPRLQMRALRASLAALGQVPFRAPSPAGWPDTEAEWGGPDALMKRLDFANELARRVGASARPRERAPEILGPRLEGATALAIARSESAEQGLTLLLMSPEFLRR
ncbi:DUF1800 domain-containing protein [Maricaulis sp.]|uniref:DUF1800 domain-containing protein n=1 Tax=Maricaulis sp. TaxID=1486257 RepID=UPI002B26782A|nr:DUF1800 domain-containing protein [Maricaulis sp.]